MPLTFHLPCCPHMANKIKQAFALCVLMCCDFDYVCVCMLVCEGVWILLMYDASEKNYMHSRGYGAIPLRSI